MTEFNEDRYFDPDPTFRKYARELYDETRALPIVSPHGHVPAELLAANDAFTDPASLIVTVTVYVPVFLYLWLPKTSKRSATGKDPLDVLPSPQLIEAV